jgi:hypothetical protein
LNFIQIVPFLIVPVISSKNVTSALLPCSCADATTEKK